MVTFLFYFLMFFLIFILISFYFFGSCEFSDDKRRFERRCHSIRNHQRGGIHKRNYFTEWKSQILAGINNFVIIIQFFNFFFFIEFNYIFKSCKYLCYLPCNIYLTEFCLESFTFCLKMARWLLDCLIIYNFFGPNKNLWFFRMFRVFVRQLCQLYLYIFQYLSTNCIIWYEEPADMQPANQN